MRSIISPERKCLTYMCYLPLSWYRSNTILKSFDEFVKPAFRATCYVKLLNWVKHFKEIRLCFESTMFRVFQGETPLHIACQSGLTELVRVLLHRGANANAQTLKPPDTFSMMATLGIDDEQRQVTQQTPLHLALANNHNMVVHVFLQYKSEWGRTF